MWVCVCVCVYVCVFASVGPYTVSLCVYYHGVRIALARETLAQFAEEGVGGDESPTLRHSFREKEREGGERERERGKEGERERNTKEDRNGGSKRQGTERREEELEDQN